jgi:hypothetical protein
MRTDTGEIVRVPRGQPAPQPSVPLTRAEAKELEAIPNTAKIFNHGRLRRYKQMHADDSCRSCGVVLRKHTLKQFQQCYAE